MAGASDKARWYLEQSVPELQELERKQIFSRPEITSITKKRSDFEHKINARGSHPSDYARYAEYEMNLDTLRRKRSRRLGAKPAQHVGERRVLFILDRATRKFHGDLGLWMQYLEYAKKLKAYKKIQQLLTSFVRLHPTKPEVWIYAATYALNEQGDMTEARSYFQRGLRFCKWSRLLWLDYARAELIYIAKIVVRQQVLGVDEDSRKKRLVQIPDGEANGHISLAVTAEDVDPNSMTDAEVDPEGLKTLNKAPMLSGAIPIAIYDTAMAQFKDAQFGRQFFDMVSEFDNLPCLNRVLSHIVDSLLSTYPKNPYTLDTLTRQSLVTVDPHSREFPLALGTALKHLKTHTESGDATLLTFVQLTVRWLSTYLNEEGLDPDIVKVLLMTLKKSLLSIEHCNDRKKSTAEEVALLLADVKERGENRSLQFLSPWVAAQWPVCTDLV